MIDGGAQHFSAAGAAKPDQAPSNGSLEPRIMGLSIVVSESWKVRPRRESR